MHYAEFAEDEVCIQSLSSAPWLLFPPQTLTKLLPQSQHLLSAIKEYENNKWKVIGQKVGKPAKACEQHAKEHWPGNVSTDTALNVTMTDVVSSQTSSLKRKGASQRLPAEPEASPRHNVLPKQTPDFWRQPRQGAPPAWSQT
jgi:hypothetical protein